jgi:hypothetical protein
LGGNRWAQNGKCLSFELANFCATKKKQQNKMKTQNLKQDLSEIPTLL